MNEVVVQRFEDELEAETAAGLLRANDIEARVQYRATMGVPRPVVPIRVVAPTGEYQLVVPAVDAARASEVLAEAGPPAARPMRYRWLGWLLLVAFFAPLLIQALAALFDIR